MSPNVFISYSPDTRSYAEELAKALEGESITTWAAFKNIRPGQRWTDEIEQAASQADWFVILVRPDSPRSQWQESEWQLALINTWKDSGKKILPVVLGAGTVHPFSNWVPLHVLDPTRFPKWTSAVASAIKDSDRESHAEPDPELPRRTEERFKSLRKAVDETWSIQTDDRPVAQV